jgi:hypothetical protein
VLAEGSEVGMFMESGRMAPIVLPINESGVQNRGRRLQQVVVRREEL